LNALTVLARTRNIKNPLLWYVAKRMYEEGMDLYEESQKLKEALSSHIRSQFWHSIYSRVDDLVEEAINLFYLEDADITEIISGSSWGYFTEDELNVIDPLIKQIITHEIFPELKEGSAYAEELLEKAGVDMSEFD